MPMQLILLIVAVLAATSLAGWAYVAQRNRERVLSRITGALPESSGALLTPPATPGRLSRWLSGIVPESLTDGGSTRERLLHAGISSSAAPVWYVAAEAVLAGTGALLMGAALYSRGTVVFTIGVMLGIGIGLLAPRSVVERMRTRRQERIRRSIPDSLDMLLVCVEAGVSLDAAILRVGRELATPHPELAGEFMMLNRRQNAGMSREEALKGLWDRTGVRELRALASNILQSERWGTSIARALRVHSSALRRTRRENAARRAAMASTKMVFPLVLLILPALLIVIGGPTFLVIRDVFNEMAK